MRLMQRPRLMQWWLTVDKQYKAFTKEEMVGHLPVVVSDMKHHTELSERVLNNANIRRDLYRYVMREMFEEDRFLHKETVEKTRQGLFIKGYVRDVWEYLEVAYDLIHATDFEAEFASILNNK